MAALMHPAARRHPLAALTGALLGVGIGCCARALDRLATHLLPR